MGSNGFICLGHSQFNEVLILWCYSLGAFGIKFIIYLAKFNSQNFASKLTP